MNLADNNPSFTSGSTDSAGASVNVAALERLSDVELLRQFVEQKNQSAMTAIIDRHGRLVMSVCRQILKSEHDAADAFQATFLVLLKKADSLHKLTSLAGWLYGVARRVAQKARSQSSRRQKREGAGVAMNPTAPPITRTDEETINLIHSELERLPEKYRLPLILCCLEGEARERAAELLGWTVGSLKGRLERGREMLIARLERRGVILSAAILTGLMAQQASAAVPVAVASSTVSALSMVAAGQSLAGGAVSVQAVTLTEGVLKAMLIAKLKVSAIVLLAGGLATTGSVVGIQRLLAAPPAQKNGQATPVQVASNEPKDATKQDEPKNEPELSEEDVLKLRRQSMSNIKSLGLAMHAYHGAQGTFPPAAVYGKDGKPLLSWRVLLLPHLGQDDLYRQFKLDEPWDSPHNKPLLAKMPSVYGAPGASDKHKNETFYQVFTGKGTMFQGQNGISIDKIKDGLGNTLYVIEAKSSVPWTKPADLVFEADKPLPKLGGVFKDGFCSGLADGSARFIPRDIADVDLRPWITPAAGDVSTPF